MSGEVTARVLLAAHAPAEPQDWFKPNFPPPPPPFEHRQPNFIGRREEWSMEDRATFDLYQRRVNEHINARRRFDAVCEKLRRTQWPWAWADAVLEQQGDA